MSTEISAVAETITFFLLFVRHTAHRDNRVESEEYAKQVGLGERLREWLTVRKMPLPTVWHSSPRPRAVTAGLATADGLRVLKDLTLASTDEALGDIGQGSHPFTPEERVYLGDQAKQRGCSLEQVILTDQGMLRAKVRQRGAEGKRFVLGVLSKLQTSCQAAPDLAITVMLTTHGGRIEPTIGCLVGEPPFEVFPEPVAMGSVTLLAVTFDLETDEFVSKKVDVFYLGLVTE